MPAETEAINNIIAAGLPMFEKKASEVENKHLCHHVQMLAEDLDSLGETYFRKHELTLNAPVVQSAKLACVISYYFSIFPFFGQVEIMHAILNKKKHVCIP